MKKIFYQRTLILAVLVLLWSALAPGIASGQEDSIVAKRDKAFIDEPGTTGDQFGFAVAVDGNMLAIGAPYDDDHGTNSGCAYLYNYTESSDFKQTQNKLTEKYEAQDYDFFGNSLAIGDDFLVIGVYQDDNINGDNAGAAYVMGFSYDGEKWTTSNEVRLTPKDAAGGYQFGNAVAVSGNRVVVADKKEGVYVFDYDGSVWQETKITPENAQAGKSLGFGSAVAIDGDTIVVGAIYGLKGDSVTGSVYVFEYNSNSSRWEYETELFGEDLGGDDKFGSSVALEGDTLVVGAPYHDDVESNSGAAYVLRRNGDTWIQETKLTGSDLAQNDRFGSSVALSGNTVVVGAPRNDLEVYDPEVEENIPLKDAGSAYLFRFEGAEWKPKDILLPSDAKGGELFGWAVALRGDALVVGAHGERELSGSAYVYSLVPENQPPVADAGENLAVEEGSQVTLDGSNSYDPDGDDLSYSWTQPDGQDVDLGTVDEATLTFTAPPWSAENQTLKFQLEVKDDSQAASNDEVEVTVLPSAKSVTEINSVLGSDHRHPWGIDKDMYTFQGTEGKQVTVTLKAKVGGKNNHGDRATLQLKDNIKGIGFQRTDSGRLPNQICVTLPATGEYQVIVAGKPRSFRGKRFLGEYTLTVEGSSGSLEKGAGTPVVNKNSGCPAKPHQQQSMWNWILDRFRH